jgi:hypothetical protein
MSNSIIELNKREISVISGGASYEARAMKVMHTVAKYVHQTTKIAVTAVELYVIAAAAVTTIQLIRHNQPIIAAVVAVTTIQLIRRNLHIL